MIFKPELEEEIRIQEKKVTNIVNTTRKIAEKQQTMEEQFQDKVVDRHEQSGGDFLKLMTEVRRDTIEEAQEIAQEFCIRNANSTGTHSCCDDCAKPKFRLPSVEQCAEAGCSHMCVYTLGTCDMSGKAAGPCKSKCKTSSPFGETKRPFCIAEGGNHLFCDCPVIKCHCPEGQRLGSDGKSCVVVLQQLSSGRL